MSYQFENVEHYKNLPIRVFFHSIKECSYHWHRDIELLFVLKGMILVQADYRDILLKRNDLFLIDSGDIHFTHESGEKNLILALQIDPSFIDLPFIFIPSSEAVVKFPALVEWNLSAERQYFNNLISSTQQSTPIILDLQNEIKNTTGDSAVFQYDYTLTLSSINENIPTIYKGNVKFYIFLDSRNQWAIGRWEDIKIGSDPSWSDLKGAMY